jgi:Xaa-Pro aminopeptidase
MDFGSKLDGYCSDMTRTIAIGEPSAKLLEMYKIVYEAQQIALDILKPGLACKALDAAARDYIASRGYGENFGHSLGHGFGLEVHEGPTAGMRSEDILMPGMTITVEPGIYVERTGGVRIEDCCFVTEDGYIDPVSASKELFIIE